MIDIPTLASRVSFELNQGAQVESNIILIKYTIISSLFLSW